MLNTKLQDAIDALNTLDLSKLQPVTYTPYESAVGSTDMGYNGITAREISALTTDSLPTLTTKSIPTLTTANLATLTPVQLSAIGGTGGYTIATATGTGTGTGTATGLNWQNPAYTTSAIGAITGNGKAGQITLSGKDADVVINGKSMSDWMQKVEERLNMLTPNPELEKEWDDLKKLGDRYRKLEKKCKEKAEVWKKLKDLPPPSIN